MKALVLEEYGRFVWQDVPDPVCAEDGVIVKIEACAVCGSDVHGMDGSSGRRIPPVIMGHEAAGTICEVGSRVSGWRTGDRVTFDSTVYCGICEYCREGRINLCDNRRVLGVSCDEYRMQGAFAEYVAIPAHILYAIPDGVNFKSAAMVEPLSVAYHAATRTKLKEDACAIVMGAGTIGMLLMMTLRALGVKNVISADVDDAKLKTALENGAAAVVNTSADGAARLLAATPDCKGADAVFDAVGIGATVGLSIGAVKKGGAAVLVGNLAQKIDFPLQYVVTREISVLGSCASAGEYPQCLDLIAGGKLNAASVISRVVPMSEGNDWIHRVYNREEGLSKIVMIP